MTESQTSMQMKTIHQTLQLPVLKILYKQSPTYQLSSQSNVCLWNAIPWWSIYNTNLKSLLQNVYSPMTPLFALILKSQAPLLLLVNTKDLIVTHSCKVNYWKAPKTKGNGDIEPWSKWGITLISHLYLAPEIIFALKKVASEMTKIITTTSPTVSSNYKRVLSWLMYFYPKTHLCVQDDLILETES